MAGTGAGAAAAARAGQAGRQAAAAPQTPAQRQPSPLLAAPAPLPGLPHNRLLPLLLPGRQQPLLADLHATAGWLPGLHRMLHPARPPANLALQGLAAQGLRPLTACLLLRRRWLKHPWLLGRGGALLLVRLVLQLMRRAAGHCPRFRRLGCSLMLQQYPRHPPPPVHRWAGLTHFWICQCGLRLLNMLVAGVEAYTTGAATAPPLSVAC